MPRLSSSLPALALFALTSGAAPALAQHAHAHGDEPFHADLSLEFHSDWTPRADDPDRERMDTYLKGELELAARLLPRLTMNALGKLEAVRDPTPGRDRFLSGHGLFAEALFLEYDADPVVLRGGKFGQKFGIAWDAAPGIWGRELAKDYEIAEQIGFAADYEFSARDAGTHTVTAASFFADATVLSHSVLTDRGRTRRADGGPGNTGDFSSYALTLEGGGFAAAPGLAYHLAYLSRAGGAPGEARETGLAAALEYEFKLGTVEVRPLLEWARLDDQDGVPGAEASYVTTALGFAWNQWNLALARTGRRVQEPGNPTERDRWEQVSVGYSFANGIGLDVGYLQRREAGLTSHTYGAMLTYAYEF